MGAKVGKEFQVKVGGKLHVVQGISNYIIDLILQLSFFFWLYMSVSNVNI